MPARNAAGKLVCPRCNNTGQPQPAWGPIEEPWSAPGAPGGGSGENARGAVASMVLGILGIVIPYVGWILAIIAWVLGAKARNRIREDPSLQGKGMATAGFVLGIIGTIGLLLVVILAAVVFVLVSDLGTV